jgi:AraC-like DNA-binding protein
MNTDPWADAPCVLDQLAAARRDRDEADRRIRQLVAYGRTLTYMRPYRLADLAEAAGMSISGVRTCYTADDVTAAHAENQQARKDTRS